MNIRANQCIKQKQLSLLIILPKMRTSKQNKQKKQSKNTTNKLLSCDKPYLTVDSITIQNDEETIITQLRRAFHSRREHRQPKNEKLYFLLEKRQNKKIFGFMLFILFFIGTLILVLKFFQQKMFSNYLYMSIMAICIAIFLGLYLSLLSYKINQKNKQGSKIIMNVSLDNLHEVNRISFNQTKKIMVRLEGIRMALDIDSMQQKTDLGRIITLNISSHQSTKLEKQQLKKIDNTFVKVMHLVRFVPADRQVMKLIEMAIIRAILFENHYHPGKFSKYTLRFDSTLPLLNESFIVLNQINFFHWIRRFFQYLLLFIFPIGFPYYYIQKRRRQVEMVHELEINGEESTNQNKIHSLKEEQ